MMRDEFINASRQTPTLLTENADFKNQIYDASKFPFVLKSPKRLSKLSASGTVY